MVMGCVVARKVNKVLCDFCGEPGGFAPFCSFSFSFSEEYACGYDGKHEHTDGRFPQ